MQPLRITLVIPFIALTGGIKATMEYANRLQARGHRVTVIYPQEVPYRQPMEGERLNLHWGLVRFKREGRYWLARALGRSEVDWFDLRARLVRVPSLLAKFIPQGDVIMAVDWRTAEWVRGYSLAKGVKFFLIQHYETWSGPRDRVDATWRTPVLAKIVVSSWLKGIAEDKFGVKVYGPLPYGVDFHTFYNNHKGYNSPPRIGMLYHDLPWKGVVDGLRAFESAQKERPGIQLIMFGAMRRPRDIPDYVEYHARPLEEELRRIYCSCDIWLCPSWAEGCHMPPMEAMACKCAVVTTDVGGIRDYAVPGQTALVSPPKEPEALARNLLRLLDDEEKLRRISIAGHERIQGFTWEKATRQLEALFYERLAEE